VTLTVVRKMDEKNARKTSFKFAKKLITEYLLSKNDKLNSNDAPTQKFIKHLQFFKTINKFFKLKLVFLVHCLAVH
jgi:hypothetical protein